MPEDHAVNSHSRRHGFKLSALLRWRIEGIAGLALLATLGASAAAGTKKGQPAPLPTPTAVTVQPLTPRELASRYSDAIPLLLGLDAQGKATRLGSGVFLSPDGTLVTNFHVVRGLASVVVRLANREEHTTDTCLGFSEPLDLAILAVPGVAQMRFVPLADSDTLVPGEPVTVIGNPEGLAGSISTGIVSAVRWLDSLRMVVQFTAPISHGSSGGAVLTESGRLAAVVTSTYVDGQNLNFGVPANDIRRLLESPRPVKLASLPAAPQKERPASSEPADPVTGTWMGIASNTLTGKSAQIRIEVVYDGQKITGHLVVFPPLGGSGPITGSVEGQTIKFRSKGTSTIDWEGQLQSRRIVGEYVVSGLIKQRGAWSASR